MRKFLLSLVLTTAVGLQASADSYNYLTLNVSGQVPYGYALKTVKKITFDGERMIVTTSKGEQPSVALAALQTITFDESMPVGVQRIHDDGQRAPIYIYNVNGQMVRHFDGTSEQGQLNLSGLPQGLYIVKQGTEIRKMLKR